MFDEQKAEHVLEQISEGKTLSEVCRTGIVARATFNRWRAENPPLETAFARAIDEGSEALEDRTAEIEQRVLDGDLDPQAAYTVLRNIHWRTKVRTPKRYGDRVQQDIDMTVRVAIADPARQLRNAPVAKQVSAQGAPTLPALEHSGPASALAVGACAQAECKEDPLSK